MKNTLKLVVASAVLFASYAGAQSCSSLFSTMQSQAAIGNKTIVTMMARRPNGVEWYSGAHGASTAFDGKMLYSAGTGYMTSEMTGGVVGKEQFNDRANTSATPSTQPFSVLTASMENVYFWMNASTMYVHNTSWGFWTTIPITCAEGVVYGVGVDDYGVVVGAFVFSVSYGT